jgi:uncharacterized protein (DUF1499 family)
MRFLAVVPLLLNFAGIGLSSAGVLPAMVGWVLFALGTLIGLVVSITIFTVRVRRGQPHFRVFAIIAALPLTVAVPIVIHDLSYPRINDVTTDVKNPLAFTAALEAPANAGRDMTYPEHFGPIVREAYPNVRPLVLDESAEQVFQRVEKLAEIQPDWVITNSDAEIGTVEGEATTSIFRFVDDFVIRVSDQDGQARVEMRSKSRDGLVDGGANAKRIRTFFAQLARKQTGG